MAYPVSVNNEVDPISRIEGHLGIAVVTDGGTPNKITNAFAHGNLWRGFENFLLGRDVNDAITFVQRICGVCPVPHGMTSTYAVDTVLGYSKGHITFQDDGLFGVPANAVLIRNLVLGMEFVMSSITHFYHLAAPSYIQGPAIPPWTPYFDNSYYHAALLNSGPNTGLYSTAVPWATGAAAPGLRAYPTITPNGYPGAGFSIDVWSTVIRSYVVALRVRRLTFEAGALFAGRMPMTSTYIGGGVCYDKGEMGTAAFQARCDTFKSLAHEVGEFVVQEYIPIALALGVLYPNYDNLNNAQWLQTNASTWWGLAGNTASAAPTSADTGYGAGLGRFLAWGAFPSTGTGSGTSLLLAGGVKFKPTDSQTSFVVSTKGDVESKFLTTSGSGSVSTNLKEGIHWSRYGVAPLDAAASAYDASGFAYPGNVARTKPQRASGYTYMKAPRWDGLACEVGPMARMFVSGLFTNASSLATTVAISGLAGYAAYVKGGAAATGLDPAMIKADIAVALVQVGLATLVSGASATVMVGNGAALPTAASATVQAYSGTGAFAGYDTVIKGPIFDWIYNLKAGYSTMDRLRGRALESLVIIQGILGSYTKTGSWAANGNRTNSWHDDGWLSQLRGAALGSQTFKDKGIRSGTWQGWGATEAPRGALMHQCTITDGKITKYQCIVPTTWNGSPVSNSGGTDHGAIEQAVIGAPFATTTWNADGQGGAGTITGVHGGVEVLRIAQSFDPCIACAVH